jgi:hypothetical protein
VISTMAVAGRISPRLPRARDRSSPTRRYSSRKSGCAPRRKVLPRPFRAPTRCFAAPVFLRIRIVYTNNFALRIGCGRAGNRDMCPHAHRSRVANNRFPRRARRNILPLHFFLLVRLRASARNHGSNRRQHVFRVQAPCSRWSEADSRHFRRGLDFDYRHLFG